MKSGLNKRLAYSLERFSDRRLVTFKSTFFYKRYSYEKILTLTQKFITLLKKEKVKKGDKILICSYNNPQFIFSFLGSLFYGTVFVPIDFGSSESFIKKIAKETEAKFLITSQVKQVNSDLKTYNIESLEEILEPFEKSSIYHDVSNDDLAEIMYTSGTTGDPKGVMLTHGNVESNIEGVLERLSIDKHFRFLSIIPLSHILEQIAGFFILVSVGAQTIHLQSRRPSEIRTILKKEKITCLVTVPAFLDLLKKGIENQAREKGSYKKLKRVLKLASSLPYQARRLLFHAVHKEFGGRLIKMVSGGAPLRSETQAFWMSLGIKIIQGYGLTETSPVLTADDEYDITIGSVGSTIKDVELKITKDGEILAKGPNITPGYFKNKKKTDELFHNGWLKTGDMGYLDEDGKLFIKGRKKNMILKDAGLNIYPEDIEKILNGMDEIKESCVIGKPVKDDVFVCAVIIPENRSDGIDNVSKKAVRTVNEKLEAYQRIQDIVIWKKKQFPKTHTMKIKRGPVLEEVMEHDTEVIRDSESKDDLVTILSETTHTDADNITDDTNLYMDLKLDSIKVIELATVIEEKLRVEIEEHHINKDTTVKDLRTLIHESKKPKKIIKLSYKYLHQVWKPIRFLTQEMVFALVSYFCKITVVGKENAKKLDEQAIIVFNHLSYFDVPAVLKAFPLRVRMNVAGAAAADHFFVKKRYMDKRMVLSRIMQLFIPVYAMSRDKDVENRSSMKRSLQMTGEIIDRGYSLVLAPEGTRTLTGKMQPFKKGIGMIVKDSGLPVVPVKLEGLYEIYPKGKSLPVKKGPVTVKIGVPIRFSSKDSVISITKKLESVIHTM